MYPVHMTVPPCEKQLAPIVRVPSLGMPDSRWRFIAPPYEPELSPSDTPQHPAHPVKTTSVNTTPPGTTRAIPGSLLGTAACPRTKAGWMTLTDKLPLVIFTFCVAGRLS